VNLAGNLAELPTAESTASVVLPPSERPTAPTPMPASDPVAETDPQVTFTAGTALDDRTRVLAGMSNFV
jgi:hypothetical protein